eukprot:4323723-Prymnesium_polylepis.2
MEGRTTAAVLDDLASIMSGWTLSERASLLEYREVEVDGIIEIIVGHEICNEVVQLRLAGKTNVLVSAQTAMLA